MDQTPLYGRRSDPSAAPQCPRHPHERSVSYCKRCNRPTCMTCTLPTEVGTICVECSQNSVQRLTRPAVGAPVTMTLIGINVALHLLGMVTSTVFQLFAFFPPVAYFEPWRFLTTAFLHSGIMHLLFNMLALYWTGQGLEAVMGKARFLALYLLSALGGTTFVLAWCLVDPSSFATVTVGASGAVFGMFGAAFVLTKVTGADTRSIVAILALNVLYGFLVPNISWQGHLGGLVVGAFVAYALLKLDRPVRSMTARQQEIRTGAALGALAIVLVAVQFGIYELLIRLPLAA